MNFVTRIALILSILIVSSVAVRADLITDWNAVVFDTLRAGNVEGAPAARILAIVHVSMADAVNTAQIGTLDTLIRASCSRELCPRPHSPARRTMRWYRCFRLSGPRLRKNS